MTSNKLFAPAGTRRFEAVNNMPYVLGVSLASVIVAFIFIGSYMGLNLPQAAQ